jgi:hypothetical protein
MTLRMLGSRLQDFPRFAEEKLFFCRDNIFEVRGAKKAVGASRRSKNSNRGGEWFTPGSIMIRPQADINFRSLAILSITRHGREETAFLDVSVSATRQSTGRSLLTQFRMNASNNCRASHVPAPRLRSPVAADFPRSARFAM